MPFWPQGQQESPHNHHNRVRVPNASINARLGDEDREPLETPDQFDPPSQTSGQSTSFFFSPLTNRARTTGAEGSLREASQPKGTDIFEVWNTLFAPFTGASEPVSEKVVKDDPSLHVQGKHSLSRMATIESSEGSPRISFSFSPAGLLLPYHIGVLDVLRHFDIVTDETPLAGASAGALAAVTGGLGMDSAVIMQAVFRLQADIRMKGAPRRLKRVLERELWRMLPKDAWKKLNQRKGKVTISYTNILPFPSGVFVTAFHSQADLIEVILASCCIPLYFATWPAVTCRGKLSVDGYFAVPRSRFGCPVNQAARTVNVLPFKRATVGIACKKEDCISPSLCMFDSYLEKHGFLSELREYLVASPAPMPDQSIEDRLTMATHAEEAATISQTSNDTQRGFLSSFMQPLFSTVGNDERLLAKQDTDVTPQVPSTADNDESNRGLATQRSKSVPPRDLGNDECLGKSIEDRNQHRSSMAVGKIALASEANAWSAPTLHLSMQGLLKHALNAADTDLAMQQLFDLGRADAFRWMKLEERRLRHKQVLGENQSLADYFHPSNRSKCLSSDSTENL